MRIILDEAAFKQLVRDFRRGSFRPNCACCGNNLFGVPVHIDWNGKRFLHDAKKCKGDRAAAPAPTARGRELVAA